MRVRVCECARVSVCMRVRPCKPQPAPLSCPSKLTPYTLLPTMTLHVFQAKVLVGEPGHPVANGTTGRKGGRLAPTNSSGKAELPAVMDHSFSAFAKASVSVNIFIKVPRHLAHSWLRGPVRVTVRCCALDPSTIWRHVAELAMQILTSACLAAGVGAMTSVAHFRGLGANQKQRILEKVPVFLVIATDGGADHTNASVQNQCSYIHTYTDTCMYVGVLRRRSCFAVHVVVPRDQPKVSLHNARLGWLLNDVYVYRVV